MSNPPADTASEAELRAAALERLRKGMNPFATQVAAVGTAEESLLSDVPEFSANQLAELLDIIATYRDGRPATRAFAVLGERGAGKTHLFYNLRNELKRQAAETGEETLLVVVDRLSTGMDATDYLLWQIVNHFLAHKGEGGRMLSVVAGRLTGRLLAESLRQLPPHQKAELIPSGGFFGRLVGGAAKAQAKIDAIDKVIQTCDGKHPSPGAIRAVLGEAGVKAEAAVEVIEKHLERTESNDVVGWLRKELYRRLARFALLDERETLEELQTGGFEDARAHIKNAGNVSRRLLETWLELLSVLNVPVVIAFDQLEDYVNAPDPEQEKMLRKFFTDATAKFINELRSVCLLIFANETFWIGLMNAAEPFAKERLTQPITLPGRPARAHLSLPEKLPQGAIEQLIRRRLLHHYPDLDLTGLSPTFPFESADLRKFGGERSIRMCLRAMARRFDDIVHPPAKKKLDDPPPPPKLDLKKRLGELWREQLAASEKRFESEINVNAAFIPEVQNALDGWLQTLLQNQLTGTEHWSKVELVTNTKLGVYGYVSVIRTGSANSPGVGIAAWLGQKRGQPQDLRQRVEFFGTNPCPIKTLVMLRPEGEAALNGAETKKVYETATAAKRDIRVKAYEPHHLHAMMAFAPWHQAAVAEVQTAKETDSKADDTLKEFLTDISKELLGWVEQWRQPKPTTTASGAKGGKLF